MDAVRRYHENSKHRLDRYAPGPGGLDWAAQPAPFRCYDGAPGLELPLLADQLPSSWDRLLAPPRLPPQALNVDTLAGLLQLSLGLSAWKSYGGQRWALRCNPSSGNLHPTEGTLICPPLPGIAAGVHHYRPDRHALERRAAAPFAWQGGVFVGLTGIHWREVWKYGLRAFRYCQLDCGHALAALAYAAALYGWPARLLSAWGDAQIAALCGVDRPADFPADEPETPEALLWIGPGEPPAATTVLAALTGASWSGRAVALSATHRDWPGLAEISAATRQPPGVGRGVAPALAPVALPDLTPAADWPAAQLIQRRRSAQAFDGVTSLAAPRFFRLLDALLPRPDLPPWLLPDRSPSVHPLLFVHRIDDLSPGLYCLPRSREALDDLRAAMRPDWLWERVAAAPEHLPLYLLAPLDVRGFAATAACHQDIAADAAFSLALLARFDDIDAAHPWYYRERYREAGLLGQVLYLEAEAAGVQGTGIGCYFDDVVHRALGLDTERFQDVYHFTVGGALIDERLGSATGYAHLQRGGAG